MLTPEVIRSSSLACLSNARMFSLSGVYRCLNAIFGKVGRIASDEVIIELFKKKCLALYCSMAPRLVL